MVGRVGEGWEYTFFSFKFQKDNITALTYQHRNDRCIARLEGRRARRATARSEEMRRFDLRNRGRARDPRREWLGDFGGAHCNGRSTFRLL